MGRRLSLLGPLEFAGHIVELQLKTNKIDHTDAYLSRNVITRSVDSLNNDQPNGSFNGKNALCVNFEDNLPDIGNGTYEKLIDFSVLPDHVRGYENVRLNSMKTYYQKSDDIFKSTFSLLSCIALVNSSSYNIFNSCLL